jgi:hypothetical protein
MMKNLWLVIALVLVAVPASAQRWEPLGTRIVSDRADHDTIVVTGARGDFTGVKLTVQRSAVRFYRVVVHFASGGREELELRDVIPAGGETRTIDLRGGDRIVRSVDFWYEAKSIGRRGAVVRLLGRR